MSDASTMNGLNFTLLPWYIMGPGIALLLSGALALLTGSRARWRTDSHGRVAPAEAS